MADAHLSSLILIGLCIILSAFFSSSEAAFLTLERIRLVHLLNTNKPGAQRVAGLLERPERLLSTILLGNNLVNVAFTALITVVSLNLLGEGREALATILATVAGTVLLLIFGETIPKTIAVHQAERISFWYARPLKMLEMLFWPIIFLLQGMTNWTTKLLGVNPEVRDSITEGELLSLIDIGEAEGTFESSEAELLQNVFRFGDRQVREVMTPRPEMVSVQHSATLSEFLNVYGAHSHTRFPVYNDSSENIIGILSAKDVLRAMASNGGMELDATVTDVIRRPLFVPETKRTAELFEEMRKDGHQMAIIVDEYGGLAGLVTLKRLSEEVVGAHGEEGEAPEEEYESLGDNTFQVEAAMSIDEANEELELNLPDGDFDTLAGFVLDKLGHIPDEGEILEYEDLKIEVIEMRALKIETIKVTRASTVEYGWQGYTSGNGFRQ
jgi:putative hemolysin